MAESLLQNTELSFSTDGTISTSGNFTITVPTQTAIWPTVAGTANQVLSIGTVPGTMEWVDQPSPGGVAGSVQYNSDPAGTLDGNSTFVWDPTNDRLLVAITGSDITPLVGAPSGFLLDVRGNSVAGQSSGINIEAGTTGNSFILFIDTDGFAGVGASMLYNHVTNALSLSSTGTGNITLQAGASSVVLASTNDNINNQCSNGDFSIFNQSGDTYIWPTTSATANQLLSAGSTVGTMQWYTIGNGWDTGTLVAAWYTNQNPATAPFAINGSAFWSTGASDYFTILTQNAVGQTGRLYTNAGTNYANWEIQATIYSGGGSGADGIWLWGNGDPNSINQADGNTTNGLVAFMDEYTGGTNQNYLYLRRNTVIVGSSTVDAINFDDSQWRTVSFRKIGTSLSFKYNIRGWGGVVRGQTTFVSATIASALNANQTYFGIGGRTGGATNIHACVYFELRTFDY